MTTYKSLLSKDDISPFLEKSNFLAWKTLVFNWLLIALAFALPAFWLNPLTLILSVILLANRQLGLGILMHDCAHNALFATKSLNEFIGDWFCAAPILAQFKGYRTYHLKHHAKAGTIDDPDYPNYQPYPILKSSLRRKIIRDSIGLTGIKNLTAIFMMHAGLIQFDMSYQAELKQECLTLSSILKNVSRNMYKPVLIHLALLVVLTWFAAPWVYGLWWVAYLTFFQLFSRIRNAAEHANVPDLLSTDPRKHARTTYARWWEKLTVAPNHVNYHLEHHWLASVPPYRLKEFHEFLLVKKLLNGAEVLTGYNEVIKKMTLNSNI